MAREKAYEESISCMVAQLAYNANAAWRPVQTLRNAPIKRCVAQQQIGTFPGNFLTRKRGKHHTYLERLVLQSVYVIESTFPNAPVDFKGDLAVQSS